MTSWDDSPESQDPLNTTNLSRVTHVSIWHHCHMFLYTPQNFIIIMIVIFCGVSMFFVLVEFELRREIRRLQEYRRAGIKSSCSEFPAPPRQGPLIATCGYRCGFCVAQVPKYTNVQSECARTSVTSGPCCATCCSTSRTDERASSGSASRPPCKTQTGRGSGCVSVCLSLCVWWSFSCESPS